MLAQDSPSLSHLRFEMGGGRDSGTGLQPSGGGRDDDWHGVRNSVRVQMSKRMSVAVMAVAVLVFIAACGSNATPMPTPRIPDGHPYALSGDSYGEQP